MNEKVAINRVIKSKRQMVIERGSSMVLSKKVKEQLEKIAQRWNWENLEDTWTILEGAYCRLSWVLDWAVLDDEQKDIVQDTMDLIEALQKDIKLKI